MKFPWAAPTIRARLTGWYEVVLTAMMIVYATATLIAVRHEFLEQHPKSTRFLERYWRRRDDPPAAGVMGCSRGHIQPTTV